MKKILSVMLALVMVLFRRVRAGRGLHACRVL